MIKDLFTKFDIILLAAYRARQLSLGSPPSISPNYHKNTVIALKEINSDRIDTLVLYDDILEKKRANAIREKMSGTPSSQSLDTKSVMLNALKNRGGGADTPFRDDISAFFKNLMSDVKDGDVNGDDNIEYDFGCDSDSDEYLGGADESHEYDDDVEDESHDSVLDKKKHNMMAINFNYDDE